MKIPKNKNNSDRTSSFLLLLIMVAILALFVVLIAYAKLRGNSSTREYIADDYPKTSVQTEVSTPANSSSAEVTESPEKTGTVPETKSPELTKTKPIITFAQQSGNIVEVAGFIEGVFENGGICEVIFSQNSTTVTAQSEAFKDASTTICGELKKDTTAFSKGTWSVVLKYTSATSTGVSDEKQFIVD